MSTKKDKDPISYTDLPGFVGAIYESGLTAQGCWDDLDDYDREAIMRFGQLVAKGVLKQVAHEIQYLYDWDVSHRIVSAVKKNYRLDDI